MRFSVWKPLYNKYSLFFCYTHQILFSQLVAKILLILHTLKLLRFSVWKPLYNKYSSVPNKRAGSNKQAGRNFHEISIIEQVLINKQGGKIVEFE